MTDSLRNLLNIYLSDPDLLKGELDMRALKVAEFFGFGSLVTNDKVMVSAIERFQRDCMPYWSSLQVDSPSHLKVFGHLLFSLTQLRDADDRRVRFWAIDPDSTTELEGDNKRLCSFFHEVCGFLIVHQMLCSAQRRRRVSLNFNPMKPPISPRYMLSMLGYLREWRGGPLKQDKTPYDFYMIFKTMDLYGLSEFTPH